MMIFFDPPTLSVSARRKKLKAHLSHCHAREGSVFGSAPAVFVRIPHSKPQRVCTFIKRLERRSADRLLLSDRSGFDNVTKFGDVRRLVDP